MADYVVATEESHTLSRSFGRRCLEMWGRDWKEHVEIDPRAVALDPIAKILFNSLSLSLMKFQLNTDQSNALRDTHTPSNANLAIELSCALCAGTSDHQRWIISKGQLKRPRKVLAGNQNLVSSSWWQ
jgi:hypothetical protein